MLLYASRISTIHNLISQHVAIIWRACSKPRWLFNTLHVSFRIPPQNPLERLGTIFYMLKPKTACKYTLRCFRTEAEKGRSISVVNVPTISNLVIQKLSWRGIIGM